MPGGGARGGPSPSTSLSMNHAIGAVALACGAGGAVLDARWVWRSLAGVLVRAQTEIHWCLVAQTEAQTEATEAHTEAQTEARTEATSGRELWCLVAQTEATAAGRRERRRPGRAGIGVSGGTSSPPRRWTADVPTVQVLSARRGVDRLVRIVHVADGPSSSHRLVGGAASAAWGGRSVGLGVRLLRLV